jgi:hypothetical protein
MAPASVPSDGKVIIDADDTIIVGDARLKRHAGW